MSEISLPQTDNLLTSRRRNQINKRQAFARGALDFIDLLCESSSSSWSSREESEGNESTQVAEVTKCCLSQVKSAWIWRPIVKTGHSLADNCWLRTTTHSSCTTLTQHEPTYLSETGRRSASNEPHRTWQRKKQSKFHFEPRAALREARALKLCAVIRFARGRPPDLRAHRLLR